MKQWGLPEKILMVILCLLLMAGLGISVMRYRRVEQEKTAELQIQARNALEEERAREESQVTAIPDPAPTDTPIPVPTETPAVTPTETPAATLTETPTPAPTATPTPTPTEEPAKPVLISCRGDAWQAEDGADRASGWPAMLQAMLDEDNIDAEVYDGTWDMAGTLSQLRYAGISEDVVDAYIEKHQAAGLVDNRTETVVRADLGDVIQERTDTVAVPVICMGYYGGFGRDLAELVEQQAALLGTYELMPEDSSDIDNGSMGIEGRYLIVGYLPAVMGNAAAYDAAMEEAWGEHYLSLNNAGEGVFTVEFRQGMAEAVLEKLEELNYLN